MTHGQAKPGPDPETEPRSSPKQGVARRIGRYDVVRELGRGAMGHVYMARQRAIQRLVAIKVMRPDMADEVAARRFRREAEMMARLRHPGIVAVFDFGSEGKTPYFVMDYVEGQSLAEPIRKGIRFTHRQILEIVRDLALALHHAHQQGIIHRDLKPSNILLTTNGRPVITDFGLAADQLRPASLTATGFVVGTPLYMAPEQATGRGPVDALSDIYSLGVILFELLTGWNPRNAQSVGSVMRKAARDPLPAPSSIEPSVPPSFDAMTLRATSHDRSRRHASAQQLASQAEALLQHLGSDNQLAPSTTLARPEGASGPLSAAPPGVAPASGPPRGRIYQDRERPLRPVRSQRQTMILVTAGTSAILIIALIVGMTVQIPSTEIRSRPNSKKALEEARQRAKAKRLQEAQEARLELVKEARELLTDENGAEACVQLLEDAHSSLEDIAEAHTLRARAFSMTGRPGAAKISWDRAFELAPALVLDHIHSDLNRAHPQRREELVTWLDRASRTAAPPAALVATALLKALAGSHNSLQTVLKDLDEVVRDYPDTSLPLRERTLVLWQLGRWQEALTEAQALVKSWPEDARHHTILGRFLHEFRRFPQAREVLDHALSLRPDLAETLVELGQLKLQTFDYFQASQDFAMATRLAPTWARPLLGESRSTLLCLFSPGALEQLIQETPDSVEIPKEVKAMIERWQGLQAVPVMSKLYSLWYRALKTLSQARDLEPENARVAAELGIISFLLPQQFKYALSLNPDLTKIWQILDEPSKLLAEAMAHDPREPEAWRLSIMFQLWNPDLDPMSIEVAVRTDMNHWQNVSADKLEPYLAAAELAILARHTPLARKLHLEAKDLADRDSARRLRYVKNLDSLESNLDRKLPLQIAEMGNALTEDTAMATTWARTEAIDLSPLITSIEKFGNTELLLDRRQQVILGKQDSLNTAKRLYKNGHLEAGIETMSDCATQNPPDPLPHCLLVSWLLGANRDLKGYDESLRTSLALEHGRSAVETCVPSGFVEFLPWALACQAAAELENDLKEEGQVSYQRSIELLQRNFVPKRVDLDLAALDLLEDSAKNYGLPPPPRGLRRALTPRTWRSRQRGR